MPHSPLLHWLCRVLFSLLGVILFCPASAAEVTVSGAVPERVVLTAEEKTYLIDHPRVRLCVDPDWAPFERINERGEHEGIGADLVQLVARRVGLSIDLLPVTSWDESLAASKAGRCQLMSFLNQTPARDAWLAFTEPIFTDPNVFITREEHGFIADPHVLSGESIALPRGTMVEERIRRDFPNLRVILTNSESEAIELVSSRQADMAMRSLIVAAYTIKKEGLFNLKIAGQIPEYANELRIGVLKDELLLRDILDKGARSVTPQEREIISNRHVAINVHQGVPYSLIWKVLALTSLLALLAIFWHRKQRELDQARASLAEQRVAQEQSARREQGRLVAMLSHEMRTPLAVIDAAAQSLQVVSEDSVPGQREVICRRIERIRAAVGHLSNLTLQLLAKDRLDDATLTLKPVLLDVEALCRELQQQVGNDDRIQLVAQGEVFLQGDPNLLQVALRNLLVNALRYSPAGSLVGLSIEGEAERVRIRISNEGDPIEPAMRQQMFQSYTRGNNAARSPGTGLGLYLVKRVVDLHGGSVYLSEARTDGIEFVVELPREPNASDTMLSA
ncbi:transporter substrate-binding domain-containing protein [bacterium]|nr:MAG: transporter substrate-binding domain-containing protein [bacterium]